MAAVGRHGPVGGTAPPGLRDEDEANTLQAHNMQSESASAGRSLAQVDEAHLEHPFVKMLARRKLAVPDVVTFLDATLRPRTFPRSTVQSWYKDVKDPGYRAIPEDAALLLKAEFGVPLSAWPRVRKAKGQR